MRRSAETERASEQGNWVLAYESGLEYIEHLNGVTWADAPIPSRFHRCTPQTRGFMRGGVVRRCACGAMDLGLGWGERNARRRGR